MRAVFFGFGGNWWGFCYRLWGVGQYQNNLLNLLLGGFRFEKTDGAHGVGLVLGLPG